MMYPMDVHTNKSQRYGLFGVLALVSLAVGAFGINYIYQAKHGLIYEVAFGLLVLMAFVLLADRIFVR